MAPGIGDEDTGVLENGRRQQGPSEGRKLSVVVSFLVSLSRAQSLQADACAGI